MTNSKTAPDIGSRLAEVRGETYGDRGGPILALFLGLRIRDWNRLESSGAISADLLDRFSMLTGAEPLWLVTGRGPKYQAEVTGFSACLN